MVKGPKNILHAAFTQLNFTGIMKEVAPADSTPVLDELASSTSDAESEESARARRARVVEGQGDKVAGACQDGQAVLRRTGLLRGRRARLLGRGQDARRGDLQKSAKDTTLEHSLFAEFNTE